MYINTLVKKFSQDMFMQDISRHLSVINIIEHEQQESLANAKVSMRQPWYIGRNSLNRPSLRTTSNINVIYTS